jgi:alanine dehydrogenase
MIIGIPKETKLGETRVALVPKAVKKLVQKKHLVLVEKSAGEKSGFTDQDYQRAGAKIVKTEEVYRQR